MFIAGSGHKKPDVWWNVLGHKLICEAQETINSYQFPWCSNEIIKLKKTRYGLFPCFILKHWFKMYMYIFDFI